MPGARPAAISRSEQHGAAQPLGTAGHSSGPLRLRRVQPGLREANRLGLDEPLCTAMRSSGANAPRRRPQAGCRGAQRRKACPASPCKRKGRQAAALANPRLASSNQTPLRRTFGWPEGWPSGVPLGKGDLGGWTHLSSRSLPSPPRQSQPASDNRYRNRTGTARLCILRRSGRRWTGSALRATGTPANPR